jgi:predicted site-specific integrase-resolvase
MTTLSPAQAALELGISVKTLRGHVEDGTLTFINIGRGKKYRRMAFDPADLEDFKLRRKETLCPSTSTKTRLSTTTTSGSKVIGFMARLNALTNEKPRR